MTNRSYNLLTENWLSWTKTDGSKVKEGVEYVLVNAHELSNPAFSNPLFEGALIRLLLALLHRMYKGPRSSREWSSIYSSGRFDEEMAKAYLDKFRDRFFLFDEQYPFYQTAGISMDGGEPLSLKNLFPEIATGNNKTIFNHSFDSDELVLSPEDAAKGLISAQMYSLGGLFKKSTSMFGLQPRTEHASLVRGIPVYAEGENLFETLTLNLLITDGDTPLPEVDPDSNIPFWERTDKGSHGKVTPAGYMQVLVPCNRHIRLTSENGSVTGMHMAHGEEPTGFIDPFFIKADSKQGKEYSIQLDPDKLLWRDSGAIFSKKHRSAVFRQLAGLRRRLNRDSLNCTAYAFANKDANPLAFRKESLRFPTDLLDDDEALLKLEAMLESANNVYSILGKAIFIFFDILLDGGLKDVQKEKRGMTNAKELFWSELELPFRQFLMGIGEEDCVDEWKKVLKRTAVSSFRNSKGMSGRSEAKNMQARIEAEAKLFGLLKKELGDT